MLTPNDERRERCYDSDTQLTVVLAVHEIYGHLAVYEAERRGYDQVEKYLEHVLCQGIERDAIARRGGGPAHLERIK